MSDFDKTNTFILFTNDKGDNPKRPDRTGTATLSKEICEALIASGNYDVKLSGWIKQGANGPFLAGPLEIPMKKSDSNVRSDTPADNSGEESRVDNSFDDTIPF